MRYIITCLSPVWEILLAAAGGEGVAAEFFRPDGTAYPPDAEISRSDLCSGMHLVLL